MCSRAGRPVRVKVTAQDYDGKPVQTQVHLAVTLEKWDSVTHERRTRRCQQRCDNRRGWNGAGGFADDAAAATSR